MAHFTLMQQPGRGADRQMVVARSNCSRMGDEQRSTRVVVPTA